MINDEAPWAGLPESIRPQLLTAAVKPPHGNWQYEIKYDGYRFLARIGECVSLFTRNGYDWTSRLPSIATELSQLPGCAWIDGEVVCQGGDGRPSFQSLQRAFATGNTSDLIYYAFDMMYLNGTDLRKAPLEQRRGLLSELLDACEFDHVRFSDTLEADPTALLDTACKMQLEGIVAKRLGSRYLEQRSRDWLKIKCGHQDVFVIVGYTLSGIGIASLVLGSNTASGIAYAGRIQSGLSDKLAATIKDLSRHLVVDSSPLSVTPVSLAKYDVRWLLPKLECRVRYTEISPTGRIRHGVLVGIEGRANG